MIELPRGILSRLETMDTSAAERFALGAVAMTAFEPYSVGVTEIVKRAGIIPDAAPVVESLGGDDLCSKAWTAIPPQLKFAAIHGFAAPMLTEVLFRGVTQDMILSRFLGNVVIPSKQKFLDSFKGKVLRVTLTAALYSAVNLRDVNLMSDPAAQAKAVSDFVVGLGLGAIKASNAGLVGAMGGAVAHRMFSLVPELLRC